MSRITWKRSGDMGCCQGFDESLMVVDYSFKNGSVGCQLTFGGDLYPVFYSGNCLQSVAGVTYRFLW